MSSIKLKELLLESPDTLVLKTPEGHARYIRYGEESTVVTGLIFSDPKANTEDNYVALVEDQAGERAVVELNNQELNVRSVKFLSTDGKKMNPHGEPERRPVGPSALSAFVFGQKGHSTLEEFVGKLMTHLYKVDGNRESGWGHYHEKWRFRIFFVDNKHYFTIWQSSIMLYKNNLPLFMKIVKDCGLDVNTVIWEVRTDEMGDNRVKLVDMAGLHKLMGTEQPSEESQSEIQKRLSDLSKKLSEMESDEHVKGATWSESEKRRHKIDMINIKSEMAALDAAAKSGEKEIKNVVIKTIDSLESSEGEIIPSDILYAELERKLSKYGTSAVAIMRALRDRGIDIKKALREISDEFGGKSTITELMEGLSKYMNKPINAPCPRGNDIVKENENMAMVQSGAINGFKEKASTPEEFLKLFKGHTLKELLDKVSFCRLYVMNKFGDMRGDDPQQRFVWMLDNAISFINYRLIMPHRKKVDDDEKEDNARPEVIAYRKKRTEILKQSFVAQRSGDNERATKLRQLYRDMEEPQMTRYGTNMKTTDAEIKKIHSTPLSLEDVTPSQNDSDRNKESYRHFVDEFNRFKGN